MYTTDTTKKQICWRCRKCGYSTPLGQGICSNPSCRADLSLYGETFAPALQQVTVQEEKKESQPRREPDRQPASGIWEESGQQASKEQAVPEHGQTRALSHREKKALKKQQAEARVREAAARRELHSRGPVKTFFLSVFAILVSILAGILAGGVMLMSFTEWGDLFYYEFANTYYPHAMLWHQIIPGVLLILLSVLFTKLVLKEKWDRKLMYMTIGFWAIPFCIACWKRFRHDGGDSYEMLSVYLFFLFNMEPIMLGSTLTGIKGLKKASAFLRWTSIMLLIATGVIAVLLAANTDFAEFL